MKRMRKLMLLMIIFVLCFTFISTVNVEAAGKVKINKTRATVYVGKTVTLKVAGTKKPVKWTSSNKNVATVSSKGKVTAINAGNAVITAKVMKKSFKCKVAVKNPYLNKSEVTLKKGKTLALKLFGTTAKDYTSSNKSVATISSKGKITAKSAGTTTITCTDINNKTYSCKITVTNSSSSHASHKHSYIETITKNATCAIDGEKTYTCDCGDSYTESFRAEHNWDEGVITKPATAIQGFQLINQQGIKMYTCKNCGETKNEIFEVEPNHKHAWGEGVLLPSTSCTENKIMTYTCATCGFVSRSTRQPGHTWTWTVNGNTRTSRCSVCGEDGITEECFDGVWGYFDEDAAKFLFTITNTQRVVATKKPAAQIMLKNYDGLHDIAKQRAIELVSDFSRNPKTDYEFIGLTYADAERCFLGWWMLEERCMLEEKYTQGSCAVFYHDYNDSGENLTPYYVLVLNEGEE